MKKADATVIVLASGRGERFIAAGGIGSKLQARLGEGTVLGHTLAAVRASGLPWHLEDAGHPGMGDSIAAGVRATPEANGWLILPGDLPLIRPATLRAVAEALAKGAAAVHPSHAGERGHPVGFSARSGPALSRLQGAQGAAEVLRGLRSQGGVLELALDDPGIVTDIDTPDALKQAEAMLSASTIADERPREEP
ncbi:Molybdenum cofactor cytidylyltransferase [Burkholderiales bacterium 8X]|nr:Molybdenum cofactor cytidylyltransferase [Burkholderiales bacterium 8X]